MHSPPVPKAVRCWYGDARKDTKLEFFTNAFVGLEFFGVISQVFINRRVFRSQLWGETIERDGGRNHGTQRPESFL